MSNASTIAQPAPSACPECGATRIVGEGVNTVKIARADVGSLRQASANNNTDFWALVCPECGHTTLYAKTPSTLRG